METLQNILLYGGGFAVVGVASHYISKLFPHIKLPLITGMLLVGIMTGPSALKLITPEGVSHLGFVGEIALAFIAFAAGSELYIKELRTRYKSIAWMTFMQLVITFMLGAVSIYLLSSYIPFMKDLGDASKTAIAVLTGTIFVARSPSSAIAIINELRARGPFTQTALGVTVIKDVLVIILFAICFSLSKTVVKGTDFNWVLIPVTLGSIVVAFIVGIALSKVINLVFLIRGPTFLRSIALLAIGYGVFVGTHHLEEWTDDLWHIPVHIEPLLICIVASFVVANYSKYRDEFIDLVHETGTPVYVAFFTWAGMGLNLEIMETVWAVALIMFGVRLFSLIAAGLFGGVMAGDPMKYNKIAWMPYVTQAGVALGLTTEIQNEFTTWGTGIATILISVIVINQIVGPPLFRWAISYVGEDHSRAQMPESKEIRDAIIFGLENQSIALARQLKNHGWEARLFTRVQDLGEMAAPDIDIIQVPAYTKEVVIEADTKRAEAIVCLVSDEEAYQICEWAYENLGTKDLIVRLNDRRNFEAFHKLGCKIVEPTTAIVSLLDHFVRSPQATSLLLGMDSGQDTAEFEVLNPNLHGMVIRDLRLPSDVIILSVMRGGQHIISHGYTRLRLGDFVTVVGSVESVENVALRFG